MEDAFRIVIQWLHVSSGVLWIGAGFYAVLVQIPAVNAMPPTARGPALAALAPRQVRYILRLAELTILSGFANAFVSGRGRELSEPFGTRWALMITIGILLAVGLYLSARFLTKPLVSRVLTLAPQAAGGDGTAASELPRLAARLRRIGLAQITVGAVILLTMVAARFS